MTDQNCGTCRFSRPASDVAGALVCAFFPPVIAQHTLSGPGAVSVYPRTDPSRWCGQWASKARVSNPNHIIRWGEKNLAMTGLAEKAEANFLALVAASDFDSLTAASEALAEIRSLAECFGSPHPETELRDMLREICDLANDFLASVRDA